MKPDASEILERGFLEQRARLLEVAAFLDRLERSAGFEGAKKDFRYQALLQMLQVLTSAEQNRAEMILLHLSDLSLEVRQDPVPGKALGAWQGKR